MEEKKEKYVGNDEKKKEKNVHQTLIVAVVSFCFRDKQTVGFSANISANTRNALNLWRNLRGCVP